MAEICHYYPLTISLSVLFEHIISKAGNIKCTEQHSIVEYSSKGENFAFKSYEYLAAAEPVGIL